MKEVLGTGCKPREVAPGRPCTRGALGCNCGVPLRGGNGKISIGAGRVFFLASAWRGAIVEKKKTGRFK